LHAWRWFTMSGIIWFDLTSISYCVRRQSHMRVGKWIVQPYLTWSARFLSKLTKHQQQNYPCSGLLAYHAAVNYCQLLHYDNNTNRQQWRSWLLCCWLCLRVWWGTWHICWYTEDFDCWKLHVIIDNWLSRLILVNWWSIYNHKMKHVSYGLVVL